MLKILRLYLNKNRLELGHKKSEVAGSTPKVLGQEFYMEDAEAKKGNYLMG